MSEQAEIGLAILAKMKDMSKNIFSMIGQLEHIIEDKRVLKELGKNYEDWCFNEEDLEVEINCHSRMENIVKKIRYFNLKEDKDD